MNSTNQHYVPVFYLKQFVNDKGKLFCKNKETNKSFWTSPEKICCERDYYEIKNGAFETNKTIPKYILQGTTEKEFSKYEYIFSNVLTSVIKKVFLNYNNKSLICNQEEHATLAKMIANFITRNPRTINNSILDDELKRLVQNEDIQQLSSLVCNLGFGNIDPYIKYSQGRDIYGLESDNSIVNKMEADLLKLDYYFAYTERSFITSDCPVQYKIDEDKGLTNSILALSPHVLVEFSNAPGTRRFRNKAALIKDCYVDLTNKKQQEYELSNIIISQSEFY